MTRTRRERSSTRAALAVIALAVITLATAGPWPAPGRSIAHAGPAPDTASPGGLAAIWAVDDGTKVTPGDIAHPLAAGNGIFSADPPRVRLFALRNETVAFQVILQGGGRDTTGVRVSLDAIGPIDNSASPGTQDQDPDRYLVGRHIEIFEQHYATVRERSHDIPWLPGSDAQPDVPTGRVPDALIPHRPATHPITVPAGENRGVWIDVYVPRDAPAGTHRGTVTVAVDGAPCALPACRIAVELEVLPLALPEEPPVATMLWASAVSNELELVMPRYFAEVPPDVREGSELLQRIPRDKLAALQARHFKLARRHRITLVAGDDAKPTDALAARISGQAFTQAAGYAGPGEGLGQDLAPIHMYGGKLTPEEARMWTDWFARHGPGVEHFLYVYDEPGDDALIPKLNQVARDAEPVPSFVTTAYDPRYEMDIFAVPTDYFEPARAREAAARGTRVWVYNGARPYSGTFMIDDVAISPRVNPWIQYRHGVPRWFYWEATYYKDFQGKRGHVDVFADAGNFSNRHGDRLNGDGMLMYPGRDFAYPAEDRGIDGPLPSIRLKNWRRGIEDVGYLMLARQAGHGALVDELLAVMVPRALIEQGVRADDPVSWPEDGERWLAARRQLFEALRGGAAAQVAADVQALGRPPESFTDRACRQLRRWSSPFVRSRRRMVATACAALVGLGLGVYGLIWWRRHKRHGQP